MERRKFVELVVASASIVGIAGCSESDDGGDSGGDDGENEADGMSGQDGASEDDAGEEAGDSEDGTESTDGQEDDSGETGGSFVDETSEQVTLAYGETARVSNGVQATVSQRTVYDQMGDEEPAERDRFLVVPVTAENTSDEARTIPGEIHTWEVLFGNQQVGNVFNTLALEAEGYQSIEGGEVQAGVQREGVLLFEIHDSVEASEVDVLWQDSFLVAGELDGSIDVRWSADA